MITLEGKRAIITGGTNGIGRAIAMAFAKAGAHVYVVGTNEERGKEVVSQLVEVCPELQHAFHQVDVSSHEEVSKFTAEVQEQGPIDILVNCAGVTRDKLLMQMKEEDWDCVLDVNLKSVFNLTKGVLRSMLKRRAGKIINVSSVIGLIGNAGQVNYSSSKFGMIGFTRSLAREVAGRDVSVNCIAPGFIETSMTSQLTGEQNEKILQKIPMNRLGKPEEIAQAALFLAHAPYITGTVLKVDGGMTA